MNLRDLQAIIFDVDGTVLDAPKVKLPSQALIDAVQAAKSKLHLSAATGRSWSFARPVFGALDLTDLCIIAAGTQICDPRSGRIVWERAIAPRDTAAVLAILARHGKRKLLVGDHTEDDYLLDRGVSPVGLQPDKAVSLFNYTFVPPQDAQRLVLELSQIPDITCTLVGAQRPGVYDMHITHREATKEHAIVELCRLLGVDRTRTVGVGDGHNDLHLFNAVGTKVAMGNAVPELKERADLVIGPVQQDGLAHFIAGLV